MNAQAQQAAGTYEVSADGHFVGLDGFVVPKDYKEFSVRFPKFVREFVGKKMYSKNHADREDREQDLRLLLSTVPIGSKYRKPGYNGHHHGCTDHIQVFSPEAAGGASATIFRNFLYSRCLHRNIGLWREASKDPLQMPTTLGIDAEDGEEDLYSEENIIRHCAGATRRSMHFPRMLCRRLMLSEYRAYVTMHDPGLIPLLDMLRHDDSVPAVCKALSLTWNQFDARWKRLGTLYRCMSKGTPPPPPCRGNVKLSDHVRHAEEIAVANDGMLPVYSDLLQLDHKLATATVLHKGAFAHIPRLPYTKAKALRLAKCVKQAA